MVMRWIIFCSKLRWVHLPNPWQIFEPGAQYNNQHPSQNSNFNKLFLNAPNKGNWNCNKWWHALVISFNFETFLSNLRTKKIWNIMDFLSFFCMCILKQFVNFHKEKKTQEIKFFLTMILTNQHKFNLKVLNNRD